eukprot:GHRR01031561.1.p2 GENE.GHRR01031561.1~~GHRR01031561.1.p2  ORF type:complete len:100 (-),score=19.90 GHRR01031561.1:143-442(-)
MAAGQQTLPATSASGGFDPLPAVIHDLLPYLLYIMLCASLSPAASASGNFGPLPTVLLTLSLYLLHTMLRAGVQYLFHNRQAANRWEYAGTAPCCKCLW